MRCGDGEEGHAHEKARVRIRDCGYFPGSLGSAEKRVR